MTALTALMLRDMRLAVRVGGGALMGALFFLIVVVMVPFAVGPDLRLLARIGPAILWVRCWRVCWRSTGCSPPTTRTVRSTF
jgi:heme exporter protein B